MLFVVIVALISQAPADSCGFPTSLNDAASTAGYRLLVEGERCGSGDVDGDGRKDYCAFRVSDTRWEAGCYLHRTDGFKFELIASSETGRAAGTSPSLLYMEMQNGGSKFSWAQGAAKVRLLRDCVRLGGTEAASALYCFNGAYFLALQESD